MDGGLFASFEDKEFFISQKKLEAVLQVITQSDFLSWDLQNFIYLMSLMTIS